MSLIRIRTYCNMMLLPFLAVLVNLLDEQVHLFVYVCLYYYVPLRMYVYDAYISCNGVYNFRTEQKKEKIYLLRLGN